MKIVLGTIQNYFRNANDRNSIKRENRTSNAMRDGTPVVIQIDSSPETEARASTSMARNFVENRNTAAIEINDSDSSNDCILLSGSESKENNGGDQSSGIRLKRSRLESNEPENNETEKPRYFARKSNVNEQGKNRTDSNRKATKRSSDNDFLDLPVSDRRITRSKSCKPVLDDTPSRLRKQPRNINYNLDRMINDRIASLGHNGKDRSAPLTPKSTHRPADCSRPSTSKDMTVQKLTLKKTQGPKSEERPIAKKRRRTAKKYLTEYSPFNVDDNEYEQWLQIGRNASDDYGDTDSGASYWVEYIVDKRIKKGEAEFLVKYMGYSLTAGGQQWWHTANEITGAENSERNKITDYEKRETVMKKFADVLRRKDKKTFQDKYPQYGRRKFFSKPQYQTDHSKYLDQLLRKESYINFLLEAHGQSPLYLVNWTNTFELSDEAQFMKRPDKWTEETRRSLSFEYLLSVDAPKEILAEIAAKEAKEFENDADLIFKCNCVEQCLSKCPCVQKSKDVLDAKIIGNDLVFDVDGEETIFFSCGPKCKCSEWCHRKIPSWGRRFPMILFFHENKGWGVHAACKIPKGSFVGNYTGILDRVRPTDDAHYQFLFPTLLSNDNNDNSRIDLDSSLSSQDSLADCLHYLVDSGRAGNEFSLINHSCKDGNVKAISLLNCNNTVFYEIGFVSTRDIEFGEELTYNYMLQDNTKHGNLNESTGEDKPHIKCHCRPDCPNMVVA